MVDFLKMDLKILEITMVSRVIGLCDKIIVQLKIKQYPGITPHWYHSNRVDN